MSRCNIPASGCKSMSNLSLRSASWGKQNQHSGISILLSMSIAVFVTWRLCTYSSALFIQHCVKRFPYAIECVQTDNGTEFTNRLVGGKDPKPTLFEQTLAQLGIRHKLIKPYTPRHNGKVERSHRKDNEEFYASHRFFSFDDFKKQLSVRERSYNHFPIRPLNWNSPAYVLEAFPNL